MNNEKLDEVLNGNLRISHNLSDLANQVKNEILKNPDNEFLKNIIYRLMDAQVDLASLNLDVIEMLAPNDQEKIKAVCHNLAEAGGARDFIFTDILQELNDKDIQKQTR